jgi:hypothetical protein
LVLEFLAWFWPIGITVVEGLAIVILLWKVRDQRRRHDALRDETTRMLATHQDYAAALDARLRALGSRTTGDVPIPTAEEVTGGRWMR